MTFAFLIEKPSNTMTWSHFPHVGDERLIMDIPGTEISSRITAVIDSNPLINGSISSLIADSNTRIDISDSVKIRRSIKKVVSKVLKRCSQEYHSWVSFESLIAKEITDLLIFFNYRSYLRNDHILNTIDVQKGNIFFLPSYFVFREVRFGDSRHLQFFGHRNKYYPIKEFYCETKSSERHPNLTISVSECGNFFDVLVCTTSPFLQRNEPIVLVRQGRPVNQFVALDWRTKASRKMLDIGNTMAYDFLLEEEELFRIEAMEKLFF
jgi:hypothetical protein